MSSSLTRPRPVALPAAAAPAPITTRVLDPRTLEAADLAAWRHLEGRAAEPNGYLSPHFVLPALRHLDPSLDVRLVVAEQPGPDERRLLGLALVHSQAPSRTLPLPHLAGYASRHSYLGHWLLERDHAAAAALALLRALRRRHPWAAVLTLPQCPLDGLQAAALQQAARALGSDITVTLRQQRAMLLPATAGAAALRERLGQKQHSNQERCRRRLQEQGALDWALLRGDADDTTVEHFLALEHGGWKLEEGTSLRSQPADEAFFTEMARGFIGDGRALFTELRLDGRPIASTANFVSGDMGFAFKVGWDDSLRKFGVGLLNEAGFVQEAPELCADLRSVDSGAQPASFIEALWPDRRELGTLQIPLNGIGRLAVAGLDRLRQRRAAQRAAAEAAQAAQAAEAPQDAA